MASFDDWTFRPSFPDSWISETHAIESAALTKALQQTLFSRSNDHIINPFNPFLSSSDFAPPVSYSDTPTPIPSSSDPDSTSVPAPEAEIGVGFSGVLQSSPSQCSSLSRLYPCPAPKQSNGNAATAAFPGATGKVTKRKKKPRAASKKSQTTFIVADPANFRQMVQQVTGGVPTFPVMKPEPKRYGGGGGRTNYSFQQAAAEELAAAGRGGACLPTLDTSAFFLDNIEQNPTYQQELPEKGTVSVPSGGGDAADLVPFTHAPVGGGGIDFDSFSSFPTLESWKV
ncbi:Calmodulin-binding protein 25 [Linum grandiflorum]